MIPFRAFLFLLGLFTQLRQQIDVCLVQDFALTCLGRNKYLSNQTNYFLIIWLGLFLYWRKDELKLAKLQGKVRGAITVYITITWLAYWALLSADDNSVGWDAYTNVIIHYVYPIAFIIDWILFERVRYQWKFFRSWTIYPVCYIIFALANGLADFHMGFIYDFLDVDKNGWASVLIFVIAIYTFFVILSILYISMNRRFLSSSQEEDTA